MLGGNAPGFGGFVCVCRSDYCEVGGCPQSCKLLNGLVSRTIFAQPNAVVSKNVYDRLLHYGRQPQGRFQIIHKVEECGGERAQTAVERNSIGSARHGVLANSVV